MNVQMKCMKILLSRSAISMQKMYMKMEYALIQKHPFSLGFAVPAFKSIKFLCKSGNFLLYFRTETVSHLPDVLKIYSALIFR